MGATAHTKAPMPVRGDYKELCYATWTGDAGAYPIIAILAGAVAGCTGYGLYKLGFDRDVQYDPKKRGSVVRFWGK